MFKMVVGELIFPHDKSKENMEREQRLILTEISETLKEILKIQKLILKDNKDLSKQEKELLKG